MIKGVESGNFNEWLKVPFSPEEKRIGIDLLTILEYMEGR